MDKQENGEIESVMLNEYANSLKPGDTVIMRRLENGNLKIMTSDELLDKINRLIEYNSYDECGEFKDNDVWSMKLEE